MQDKVIKEAGIIQNLIQDQSARNLQTVTHLKAYVGSLEKAIDTFIQNLEDGVEDYLAESNSTQFPEIHKLYSYLQRMVKQLTKISKGVQQSLNKHVLPNLESYAQQLEQRNIKIYQSLCNHYKQAAVAYKMMDFKPDIEDIYNPILKERQILNKSRDKYRLTLKQFQSSNENYLELTKTSILTTIKAINQLLNLDGVERYLNSSQFIKPLKPQPIITQLISEIQYELGQSKILTLSPTVLNTSQSENQIINFITYLTSSNIQEFKNYEQTRSLILSNEKYSIFFMKYLNENFKSDINLTLDKYHDVQSMVKFIFASMMDCQEHKQQILINIFRVSCKVKSINKWLLKELKAYQLFWKDKELWVSLYEYVKETKESKNSMKHYVRKIKKLSNLKWMKINKLGFKNTSNTDQQLSLEVIRQISVYLAVLEIQNGFVLQTLIHLCKKQHISRLQIQKLIKYQHGRRKQLFNQIYENPKNIKKERQMYYTTCQGHKLVIAVGISLGYLGLEDNLMNLRLVSKEWNHLLEKDLRRRYLQMEDNYNLTKKYRLGMYLSLTEAHKITEQQYNSELTKIPVDFGYKEIISLDVKRSVQWNVSLQPILSSVLCLFAYNYPDTGYLQGMNYIVEHLLRITQKPHEIYQIFQYIMRAYYLNYYSNNFAILRLRIYQLVRFMQMYIPQLALHFERQKIEGQYFLLAWSITLWGEFSGQLSYIMFDGFIVDGWIWWMKVCLWLLNENKQQFLQKRFQGIMKIFSDLMTHKLLKQNPLQRKGRNFKYYELLSKIEQQCMYSNDQISQMLDEKQMSTSPDKSRKSSGRVL